MRHYTGPKPCPSCGTPGTERQRHSADDICHDCRHLIQMGRKAKAAADADTGEYVNIYVYPDYSNSAGDFWKDVAALIDELHVPNVEAKGDYVGSGNHTNNAHTRHGIVMKKSVAEKLVKAIDSAKKMRDSAGAQGRKEGSNLLFSLNNGTILPEDFTRRANGG